MKQINQELDEQRKAEKRAVEAQKNKKQKAEKEAKLEVLKRSKYSLLKNEKDLTETQKIATSQKPLRGKMKATTASLASQPIACGC